MNCHRCDESLPKGCFRCLSCKAWTWENHITSTGNGAVTYFEEVQDQNLPRMSLGIMDECFGGDEGRTGIVLSDVALLAGGPGAGKSTLLSQTCSFIMKHGKCLYIAAEEDIRTIKSRMIRLGVKPEPQRLGFVNAMGGEIDLGAALVNERPAGFIIDSVDGLVGRDPEAELKALDIIKKYSVQLQAPALVISQVNKDLDYSGMMAKQHHVDVLLMLSRDQERKTSNNEDVRVLETQQKNRNGKTGVEVFLGMSETGLHVLSKKERKALDLED